MKLLSRTLASMTLALFASFAHASAVTDAIDQGKSAAEVIAAGVAAGLSPAVALAEAIAHNAAQAEAYTAAATAAATTPEQKAAVGAVAQALAAKSVTVSGGGAPAAQGGSVGGGGGGGATLAQLQQDIDTGCRNGTVSSTSPICRD